MIHLIITIVSVAYFLSVTFNFPLPCLKFVNKDESRLLLDFGFFLTLTAATTWSAYRADQRVQKLFILLSTAVLILYILN